MLCIYLMALTEVLINKKLLSYMLYGEVFLEVCLSRTDNKSPDSLIPLSEMRFTFSLLSQNYTVSSTKMRNSDGGRRSQHALVSVDDEAKVIKEATISLLPSLRSLLRVQSMRS